MNIQLQDDLRMPLKSKNKILQILLRNTEVDKVAYKTVLVCLTLGFFIFISVGASMIAAMKNLATIKIPYGYSCGKNSNCSINFNITSQIKEPVYVLYQINDFYQNHRRYIQSKSSPQLMGKSISDTDANICKPFLTNQQMGVNKSYSGVTLNPKAYASPCGGIARTFFNDSFVLSFNSTTIVINQTGITWPGDVGGKYKKSQNSQNTQWINPQDQHFVVWMRTSGLPRFKKLWGRIQQNLIPGQYSFQIQNNFILSEWSGQRSLILSNTSKFGAKNYLLPVMSILLGISCGVALIILGRRTIKYLRVVLK